MVLLGLTTKWTDLIGKTSKEMELRLSIKPKDRLKLGLVFLILAVIAFYIIWNYNTGFFGGFITGGFMGIGLGLIITHKKLEQEL